MISGSLKIYICKAISVYDRYGFRNELIPHFIDGDSNQLDPCFAAFSRINKINAKYWSKKLISNLQLIDKASIRIDSLETNFSAIHLMNEFYKDREVKFMLESLEIFYESKDNITNEEAEFIIKTNPKMLTIDKIKWTIQNIKALAFLSCANIDVKFNYETMAKFNLSFKNSQIQLFDSKFVQMLTFEWKSITFFIANNRFSKIKLLKTGYSLFIPLNIIDRISYLGFREILNANDINRQLADLGVENHLKDNGFIVPMGCINKIFVELNDFKLNLLNQITNIYEIFKEKHIKLTIENLGRLLEVSKLLPDVFSCITGYDKKIFTKWQKKFHKVTKKFSQYDKKIFTKFW